MNCEAVHDKFENHHPLNKNEIDFIAYIYNTNYISHSLPDLLYITLTYEILNFALIIPPATKLRGYYVYVPSVRLSVRLSVAPSAKRRHRSSIFIFGPISKIFHRFTLLVMNLIKFDFG